MRIFVAFLVLVTTIVAQDVECPDLDGRVCYRADFSQYSAGTVISSQFATNGLTFTSANTRNSSNTFANPPLPLMLFNSAAPTGGDDDLGSPNNFCAGGGPGVGSGGRPGRTGENCEALGHLLIISEDRNSNNPDDNSRGGDTVLTFARPAQINGGLDLLDVDSSGVTVTVTEFGGNVHVYQVPAVGNNGRAHLLIAELNISTIVLRTSSSAALASFDYCIEESDEPVVPCITVNFDFEPGTLIAEQYADAGVHFSSANTRNQQGQITNPPLPLQPFDPAHVTGGDSDLAGDPSLGKLLIIQENPGGPADDNAKGGDIIIDFDTAATLPDGLTIVDVDEPGGWIFVENFDGTTQNITLTPAANGNIRNWAVPGENIRRVTIHLAGSGGLAPFQVCLAEEPIVPCVTVNFDFEAGTHIAEQYADAGVHFSSANTRNKQGQITNPPLPLQPFDPAHVTGGDSDLAGDPSLGKLLIIQENPGGEADDNEKGGDIIIDFDSPASIPNGITLVDMDESGSFIRVHSFDGSDVDIPISKGADGNIRTFDIAGDNIQRITLHFAGSGGLAPFAVCFEEEPIIRCESAAFDDLAAGTVVSGQFFGMHFTSANTRNHAGQITNPSLPLEIFDTHHVTGGDTDLAQDPALGHLLIIQENPGGEPDDNERGGDIIVDFDFPASLPQGLTLVDMDEVGSYIRVLNDDGSTYDIPIQKGADGNVRQFDVTGDRIRRITLHFAGSGGVAPFQVCYDTTNEPVPRCFTACFDNLSTGTVVDNQFVWQGLTFSTANTPLKSRVLSSLPRPLMIFDSSHPTGGDVDLGSPNAQCSGGGPGLGVGGRPTTAFANCDALGHLLIISEDMNRLNPDDNERGGDVIATFAAPSSIPNGLTLVDVEEAGVQLFVSLSDGSTPVINVPRSGDNGKVHLDISYTNIVRLRLHFTGSGALDDFEYCLELDAAPAPA